MKSLIPTIIIKAPSSGSRTAQSWYMKEQYLAPFDDCSTMRQNVTHVGENRDVGPGPSLTCRSPKIVKALILADTSGRRRTCLGRMPGLWSNTLSGRGQRGGYRIQVHLSQ